MMNYLGIPERCTTTFIYPDTVEMPKVRGFHSSQTDCYETHSPHPLLSPLV